MAFNGHKNVVKMDGQSKESWFAYECGHCGHKTAGAVVAYYRTNVDEADTQNRWLLCTVCGRGSVFVYREYYGGQLFPAHRHGPILQGLPDTIKEAYKEARSCIEVSSFTATELICRKILMHVAAEKGAEEGKRFVEYIEYLAEAGYVTPPMMPWVDQIRKNGNQATHELAAPDKNRAESTLMFTAELLRLIYEMEYMTNRFVPESGAEVPAERVEEAPATPVELPSGSD